MDNTLTVIPEVKNNLEEEKQQSKDVHWFLGSYYAYNYRVTGVLTADQLASFYLGFLKLKATEEATFKLKLDSNFTTPYLYREKQTGKTHFVDSQSGSANTVFTESEASELSEQYNGVFELEAYIYA